MRLPFFRRRAIEHVCPSPWPDCVDRLISAVGAIVESEVAPFCSAWEFDLSEDGEALFGELKAAYDDINLIDTPAKAAAAARLLRSMAV